MKRKNTLDSQTVLSRENLQLSHGGLSKRQVESGNNP